MPTAGIGKMNVDSVYAQSFGNLPNETRYYDPHISMKADMRAQGNYLFETYERGKANLKALNVAGMAAGATDKILVPLYLDPLVVDTSRKFTPLVELIPRVSNRGLTAEWVKLSKGSAFTASEDAALPEVDDTYTRSNVSMKYLYAVGRVTGPSLAAVPSFMVAGISPSGGTPEGSFGSQDAPNALQLEVIAKTREIKELEENLIVNGNATTDATQFSGIITQMSTTNTVDKSTTALGLDDLDLAVQYAFDDGGRPNIGVCSSGVYTDIKKLVQAKLGYLQSERQVFWGFTTITWRSMVGDIPIVPSMFMSNVSGSKAIYFLDMSVVEMRVLQDLTYEKLAKTNDSDKFFLKIYEALVIRNTAFCSSVTAISA